MAKDQYGVEEGKAVAALVYFANEVERERAIRWLEKLKDKGHVRSYVCEEYNPNWGSPCWYIP